MKALYATAPGEYGLADRPVPRLAADEVLVRVARAGFCMNDLRLRAGILTSVAYPLVPGHQFAGEVESIGRAVTGFAVGERVVAHSYVVCGRCYNCRAGAGPHDCEQFRVMGFSRDGGLAEYCAVPEKHLFRLADHVTMDQASLVENLANAVAAVRLAAPQPAERVLVVGATPIGLLAVQVVSLVTPAVLVLAGSGDRRLELARGLGATDTVSLDGDASRKELSAILGRSGADAVIVCGYGRADLEVAMDTVGSGGRIVVEGHFDPTVEVTLAPFSLLVARSVSLQANRGWRTEDFAKALELVTRKMVDVDALITEKLPLESWKTAFETFADPEAQAVQLVLEP